MFNSTDPKTTATGILMIILGILALFGIDISAISIEEIVLVLVPILTGTGLIAASDNKNQ